MPIIFRIGCDKCSFGYIAPETEAFARTENGLEIEVPMPYFPFGLVEETGETWSQLLRRSQVIHKTGLVCLECGQLDYYGKDQFVLAPSIWKRLWDMRI